MAFKPVGIDENGNLPPRARAAVANSTELAGAMDSRVDNRKNLIPCADRPRQPVLGGLTNGTDTGCMSAFNMVATENAGQVRVSYGNYYAGSSREADGPNPITVRAGIQYGTRSGTPLFFPVYFNGKRDVTLDPGSLVESDPVFVNIPKGATFQIRTYVTVASGGKWPYGVIQAQMSTYGDGVEQGTTTTDKTTSGTVAGSNNFAYGPVAIRTTRTNRDTPAVAILGDSVSFGSGDSPQDHGYIYRGLRAGGLTVQHMGMPGATTEHFATWPEATKQRYRLAEACTSAVLATGTNDISASKTAADVQGFMTTMANNLRAEGMKKIYICTLPPRTTSTDSWATTANQTQAATEAVRVAVNDWIRNTRTGFDGYFEVADILETGRNTGIWKAGYTGDGIHPNGTGHGAAKAAINTAVLK